MRLAVACLFVCAFSAVASEFTVGFGVGGACKTGPIPTTIGLTINSDCSCVQHVVVCLKKCPDSCGNWIGSFKTCEKLKLCSITGVKIDACEGCDPKVCSEITSVKFDKHHFISVHLGDRSWEKEITIGGASEKHPNAPAPEPKK